MPQRKCWWDSPSLASTKVTAAWKRLSRAQHQGSKLCSHSMEGMPATVRYRLAQHWHLQQRHEAHLSGTGQCCCQHAAVLEHGPPCCPGILTGYKAYYFNTYLREAELADQQTTLPEDQRSFGYADPLDWRSVLPLGLGLHLGGHQQGCYCHSCCRCRWGLAAAPRCRHAHAPPQVPQQRSGRLALLFPALDAFAHGGACVARLTSLSATQHPPGA